MDLSSATAIEDVKAVVVTTLGIEDRAETIDASTPLLGGLPELDSMAVLELVAALEARFGITVDDDELTGDTFDSLGSLVTFVESKRHHQFSSGK
jgi:acyl carrier protein